MRTKPLTKTHKALRREIARSPELIKGSLVVMNRFCGKSGCRCLRGHKHRSLYLSRSHKGKASLIYIPRGCEYRVKEASRRYRAIINLLGRLSEIHIKKLIIKKVR